MRGGPLRYHHHLVPPEVKPSAPAEAAPQKRVSVVINAWNCVEALRRCLTALSASIPRAAFEVVVVDQASSDGSAHLDTEFPDITFLRLPRNFGRSRAVNIAIRTAQTDLILLLSPFVEVGPAAIRLLLEWIDANPQAAAGALDLGSDSDSLFIPASKELAALCNPDCEAAFARGLLVRKGFLQGMNYFDEKRFSDHFAELELFWQLRNAGKSVAVVSGATGALVPRIHSVSLDDSARDLVFADRVYGAAEWLGKHNGMLAGIGFRLGRALASLTRPGRALAVLSGSRIDGTQGGILA